MTQQNNLSSAIARLQLRLEQLALGNPPERCVQLVENLEELPLLAWLANQTAYPKIYWRGRRDGEQVAAIGAAKDYLLEEIPATEKLDQLYNNYLRATPDSLMRLYGGVSFDPEQPAWQGYGQARFVLPRVEIRQIGEQSRLILSVTADDWNDDLAAARATLATLLPAKPLPPLAPAHVINRSELPSRGRWQDLIEQVTNPNFIANTPKVVLARETQLHSNTLPNPWTVLHSWGLLNPTSYQYGFQFSPEQTFISCSPERLYQRLGRELSTEALAGTTIRGFTDSEDDALAQALLNDGKNSHENQLVREHIEQQLSPLSEYVGAEESPSILKLNHIQHLHRNIRAELKAGVNDLQLLQALHPTPAVGGLPRAAAMNFIRQREGFERGWYAGACGYLGANDTEFSVAIRSARFQPGQVTLFAGAGIVSDSIADDEWQELNNKLTTVLGILNGL
ncbi:isochorismate synthase [Ferrimonas lipolytica]|uniref:Isochorismate synthase MenF n=1 Tax=Ferrimonas lipolytica TaxID=2724191 RepID=A0A6H1UGG9_9GAMM|nr:isochorismate synthase [Ferrimonas lipolytica]QIZ78181.1 isochorismate synthase [Ferrimonas lipolytica]